MPIESSPRADSYIKIHHLTSPRSQLISGQSGECRPMGRQTALHRAAVVGNRDAVSALIQGGCALDLQDKEGNTALHEAAWHGFSQCVKLLVKAGANVYVKNKAGNIALHLACQNSHVESARVLLLGGSEPDSKNNAGDTCLHVAARYSHVAMIKILLGAFCSVVEKNQVGDTALHVAATLNHKKTVSLLLQEGADCSVKNNAGHTALDKARDNNHKEVTIILAKSNQRFSRSRTVRKRRDLLRAQRRAQSVPRDEMLPGKECTSAVEDMHSSDRVIYRTEQVPYKPTSSPHNRKINRRFKEKPDESLWKESNQLQATRKVTHSSCSPHEGDEKTYQLYTLCRDKDGHVQQAAANGCDCKPLIKKLEHQLKTTKKEMRSHIHTVQEQMNCKLGRMERSSKDQIRDLEKMTQDRVSAERLGCRYRIDQRATMERMEDERRQASAASDVKSWCCSKLQDMELRSPAESQYCKLVQSPSVAPSLLDIEHLPLLSAISQDSTSSLAMYVNLLPGPAVTTDPAENSTEAEDGPGRTYFEVKTKGSQKSYHNQSDRSAKAAAGHMAINKHKPLSRQLATTDSQWPHAEMQDADPSQPRHLQNGELGSVSDGSSSSMCAPSNGTDGDHARVQAWHRRKLLKERIKAHRATIQQGGIVQTLELFAPESRGEASFLQERANLHAAEVTQRFFESVSTQLERWYERKVEESQWEVERRAERDRAGLLQRISSLEEELQRLRTNARPDADS